ncbi:hypothetical protein BV898_18778 [Hypsibius exemplaris]|uniref:Uncharacterized protein n=1 Tax=Hypsibius exemplaris TaxID=2072580 RepID=A0A9X6NJH6_HYPEX|nr:hypothetical protein BV898_18778 [Hypsibius exemplaris]
MVFPGIDSVDAATDRDRQRMSGQALQESNENQCPYGNGTSAAATTSHNRCSFQQVPILTSNERCEERRFCRFFATFQFL